MTYLEDTIEKQTEKINAAKLQISVLRAVQNLGLNDEYTNGHFFPDPEITLKAELFFKARTWDEILRLYEVLNPLTINHYKSEFIGDRLEPPAVHNRRDSYSKIQPFFFKKSGWHDFTAAMYFYANLWDGRDKHFSFIIIKFPSMLLDRFPKGKEIDTDRVGKVMAFSRYFGKDKDTNTLRALIELEKKFND